MRPRSSIKRGLVLAALVVGPALFPLPGWAASADRCQEDRTCKEQTDRAAQLAGQTLYEEALTLYQSAYDRFHEPRLLINIGRCHYRLGRARKALESFESFHKAEPTPEPELEARLGQFIAEAKRAIDSDTGGRVPGDSGAAKDPGATPAVTLFVPSSADAAEPPPAASTGGPRLVLGRPLYRVVLGASALGVGAALVGLGVGSLAANGNCVTPSDSAVDQCMLMLRADRTPYTRVIDGVTPGIPLLLIGIGLSAGGIALIAAPPRRPKATLPANNK